MTEQAGELASQPETTARSETALFGRLTTRAILAVLVLGAAALRLLWLNAPPGRDEAGYLLIAGQWHPGTSVYGNYWVDRPPLLIAFFALGHALGGLVALRLLGCVVAGLTVLAAYGLGKALHREGGSPLWPAAAAVAFISTPLFGARTSNGELLAVPLVVVGLLAVTRAHSAPASRRARWWLVAGALAASACLVKQDFLDVFVFAAALAVVTWVLRTSGGPRVHVRDLGWFLLGAVGVTAAVLLVSDLLGTTPGSLWQALVVFRGRAAEALTHMDGTAASARLATYPGTLLVTGAVPLLVAFALRAARRRPSALVLASVCTILWEFVGVLAGQQAWSHYLLGLTPGLVLAASLATGRPDWIAWLARVCLCYALAATLVAALAAPIATVTTDQVVGNWLRAAHRPGDQAVILLGQPSILEVAGMESPYEHMFMLPMMVEDPHFRGVARVLSGPRAPEWVVVDTRHRHAGRQTGPALRRHYIRETEFCGYRIYLRAGTQRPIPPHPKSCGGSAE